jgi:hypothetical protein
MQRAKLFGALFACVNNIQITWKTIHLNVPILWPVRQIRWFPYIASSVVERLQATLSMPLPDRGISD